MFLTCYGDFKDLLRITASDKVLRDKAFDITKKLKYGGYPKGIALMVYKYFDKKPEDIGTSFTRADKSAAGGATKSELC